VQQMLPYRRHSDEMRENNLLGDAIPLRRLWRAYHHICNLHCIV
jgi:hypothetical protein